MSSIIDSILAGLLKAVKPLLLVSSVVLIGGGVAYSLSEGGSWGEGYMTHILIIMGHQNPIDLTGCLGRTFGIIDFVFVWLIIPEILVLLYERIERLRIQENALKASIAEICYELYEGQLGAETKAKDLAGRIVVAYKKEISSRKKGR